MVFGSRQKSEHPLSASRGSSTAEFLVRQELCVINDKVLTSNPESVISVAWEKQLSLGQ